MRLCLLLRRDKKILKIVRIFSYLKLSSFESSSQEGLNSERYLKVLIFAVTNILSRGLGLVLIIISISLTLQYLGIAWIGIWMTISSLVVVLSFLDLGIGNILKNRVALAATHFMSQLQEVITQEGQQMSKIPVWIIRTQCIAFVVL